MLVRRETRTGSNDLNVIYRPLKLDEMLGQETNRKMAKTWLDNQDVPHTLLFSGEPGCGKTTMARILALGLNCQTSQGSNPCLECAACISIMNQNALDVSEINVGRSGTKGDVDDVIRGLSAAPFSANFKVMIFDEAHKLTSASQDLLLKVIEDGYQHVYFMFATNQPQKLKKAFSGGRVTRMHFDKLSDELLFDLLVNIADFEGMGYDKKILLYLAEESNGVPRDCLPWLKQVNDEGSWELGATKEIVGILLDEEDPQIIDICKTLLDADWKKAVKMYDKVKLPAEQIRGAMTGYFIWRMKLAKNIGTARVYSDVIDFIINPIYDPGKLADHKMYNAMFKITSLIKKAWRK